MVTITVLSIIPIALMVLTATVISTPRCASPGVGLKPFIWCHLELALPDGIARLKRSGAAFAWRRALARRQNLVKEGAEGPNSRKNPPLHWNRLTSRRCVYHVADVCAVRCHVLGNLVRLITVFSYLDSITLWHYNGTELALRW